MPLIQAMGLQEGRGGWRRSIMKSSHRQVTQCDANSEQESGRLAELTANELYRHDDLGQIVRNTWNNLASGRLQDITKRSDIIIVRFEITYIYVSLNLLRSPSCLYAQVTKGGTSLSVHSIARLVCHQQYSRQL